MHGVVGLLLSSAVGYWVFERASDRKGEVRRVGRLLGGAIIVLSLVGIACAAWHMSSGKMGYSLGGHWKAKAGMCPLMGR